MADKFQFKRGTAAEWAAANPILSSGEPGVETDTKKMKIGDGVTAWTSLAYAYMAAPPVGVQYIQAEDVDDPDPAIAFPAAQRPDALYPGTTWEEMWPAVTLTIGTVSVKIWRRTA